MNFNDLSLEQQVDILTENSEQVNRMALLCFASKLGEMSEAGEKIYVAVIKNQNAKGGKENIATINIGKPLWFAFTDEGKYNFLPDEYKNQLDLEQLEIQELLDLFMHNSSAEGIAFNPFSNKKGVFFADKQIITLAW